MYFILKNDRKAIRQTRLVKTLGAPSAGMLLLDSGVCELEDRVHGARFYFTSLTESKWYTGEPAVARNSLMALDGIGRAGEMS